MRHAAAANVTTARAPELNLHFVCLCALYIQPTRHVLCCRPMSRRAWRRTGCATSCDTHAKVAGRRRAWLRMRWEIVISAMFSARRADPPSRRTKSRASSDCSRHQCHQSHHRRSPPAVIILYDRAAGYAREQYAIGDLARVSWEKQYTAPLPPRTRRKPGVPARGGIGPDRGSGVYVPVLRRVEGCADDRMVRRESKRREDDALLEAHVARVVLHAPSRARKVSRREHDEIFRVLVALARLRYTRDISKICPRCAAEIWPISRPHTRTWSEARTAFCSCGCRNVRALNVV